MSVSATLKKFNVREKDIIDVIQEVLGNNATEVKITGTVDSSEGSTGLSIFVEASDLKFFVKHSLSQEKTKDLFPGHFIYLMESEFYSNLLPKFYNLLKSKNLPIFPTFPKYYISKYLDDRQILVLEDLSPKNFLVHNILKPYDEDHIKLVLDGYAKFHSFSLAYRRENPRDWEEIAEKLKKLVKSFLDLTGPGLLDYFQKMLLDTLKSRGEETLYQKIKDYNYFELFLSYKNVDQYSVIVQEDCWNNNFLFKYENNKPVDVAIVDWQFATPGHLQSDLATFLFGVIPTEDLPKIDDYIEYYYQKFTKSLEDFGYNPQELYPKEIFLKHWQEKAKYCTLRAPFLYTKSTIPKENLTNVSDILEKSDMNFEEMYVVKNDDEAVATRTVNLIRYLDKHNLL